MFIVLACEFTMVREKLHSQEQTLCVCFLIFPLAYGSGMVSIKKEHVRTHYNAKEARNMEGHAHAFQKARVLPTNLGHMRVHSSVFLRYCVFASARCYVIVRLQQCTCLRA